MLEEIKLKILTTLGAWFIRFLHLTMRIEYVDFDWYRERVASGRQSIIAFWHGRMLMMPCAPHREHMTVLASLHRDGEIVARMVRHFGIRAVRGSTSRGSLGGLRGLLKAIKDGGDIAITPDGPRGPAFRVEQGIINIARKTGLPIVPVTFSASKKKHSAAGTAS